MAEAVRIATGLPEAAPRHGQALLGDDIAAAADPLGGHVAGIAPTGVGKSMVALSIAAVGAVDYGERWIISTESIGLQSQYSDKDGPVISEASEKTLGQPVVVEVLKGWSNYSCIMKARQTAMQMGVKIPSSESAVVNVADAVARAKLRPQVEVDGFSYDSSRMQPLVDWAIRQHSNESLHGDRGSFLGQATDFEWASVSVSPQECLGEAMCPLAAMCKPLASRERVAAADIVITNHSMLAVQAATGAPVVIGSAKLGPFHGIIVDEAHALPSIVRSQGQAQVSGRRVQSIMRSVSGILDDRESRTHRWMEDGKGLVDYVDEELTAATAGESAETVKIAEDTDPLAQSGDVLVEWLRRGAKAVSASTKSAEMSLLIRGKRVVSEIDNLVRDIGSVREHFVGTARWMEPARRQTPTERAARREWASAQSAPVQVGGMINRNLWNEVTKDEEDEEVLRPLTVACLSATLPEGFARDVGMVITPKHYPSPFDQAYGNSMLYVPRAVDSADIEALSAPNRWNPSRMGFDTGKHAEWAAAIAVKLIDANQGSALVLSATVKNGKLYAERAREHARGRWNVYSQWDGENVRVITSRWREDKSSVMVGTRSLMTGVDAPGETNTLVIVDRAPRSGSNPVDDARVEMLTSIYDRNTADRFVYVSDATLLLEQAVGRLIRSMSDSGLAAILDPRMLNVGPFKYQKPVRTAYQKAFERFTNKTSNLEQAVNFLNARAATQQLTRKRSA